MAAFFLVSGVALIVAFLYSGNVVSGIAGAVLLILGTMGDADNG